MSATLEPYRLRRDARDARRLATWIALSIALHTVLLLWSPRLRVPASEAQPPPLTVLLQAKPRPAPPPPTAQIAPPQLTPRPRAVKPPVPKPKRRAETPPAPMIARSKPAPEPAPIIVPAQPPAEAPPKKQPAPALSAPPPVETDLAAYIEARRRARGEPPAGAPSPDVERANRSVINNAALNRAPGNNFKPDKPRNGYGSFEIRRRGFDYAEYIFKGWNENFRRDGLELIEVRQGQHSSIDLAVIRSIIEIIRRTETGDFTWYSHRLGRSLTLSARARDSAVLEAFMLQEFYEDLHRYR